ncbi:MAG: aminoacyl-histidine dipeptidase [Clostridia bacterium]|nr:aminoacyl-histidine dipeptidase [Clostridia bacterium]
MILQGLQPERVFFWFEKICAIPHGSGDTKRISDFCAEFAQKNKLEYRQDELNNIAIYKAGSIGREKEAPVILQGHLDMVCEKEADIDFDFAQDGLRLSVEGDLISATGTTLGGDDGIAVAMVLAVLEDDTLSHPPIEALFTVDEETGMYGAAGLDPEWLTGRTLINIDSEEEGVLTVGCAGGGRVDIALPLIPTSLVLPCYRIVVDGLAGGHSGVEIHKGRHNACKLMGEFLSELGELQLVELVGGQKDNVIPGRSEAVISTAADPAALIDTFVAAHRDEANKDLCITAEPCEETVGYDSISSAVALTLLLEMPDGVQAWSPDIDGLVQTSLNLGIMELKEDYLHLSFAPRSSSSAEKEALFHKLAAIAHKHGADFCVRGQYPAWEFRKESPLRETMLSVYERLHGNKPRVKIIHAGLECGLLSEKLPGMDAVSIGPQMWDIHSPRERLSISSTERTYKYLLEILKEI